MEFKINHSLESVYNRTFGQKFKELREKTNVRDGRKSYLTQLRFALKITDYLKENFPFEAVKEVPVTTLQNWEQGRARIPEAHRYVLVALIAVLRNHDSLATRSETNELLSAGHYALLSDLETSQINLKNDLVDVFNTRPGERVDAFVGYEELLSKIEGNIKNGYITGIWAAQGYGKTTLAAEVSARLAADFKYIFWLHFDATGREGDQLERALRNRCLQELGMRPNSPLGLDSLCQALEDRGRLFIVLDGVSIEDEGAQIQLCRKILKLLSAKTSVLITTTNVVVINSLMEIRSHVQSLQITELSAQQALELFTNTYDLELTDEEKIALCRYFETINYNPTFIKRLALDLHNEHQQNLAGFSLISYLKQIDLSPSSRIFKNEYKSLRLSYERRLSPKAQLLLRAISIFAYARTRLDSIQGVMKDQFDDALLVELVRNKWMVIVPNDQDGVNRVQFFHGLIKLFAESLLKENAAEFMLFKQAHFEYYYDLVLRKGDSNPQNQDFLQKTYNNIYQAFTTARDSNNQTAIKHFGLSLCVESRFLYRRGYTRFALELLPQAIAACKTNEDRERAEKANLTGGYGRALRDSQRWDEAVEQFETALEIIAGLPETFKTSLQITWELELFYTLIEKGEHERANALGSQIEVLMAAAKNRIELVRDLQQFLGDQPFMLELGKSRQAERYDDSLALLFGVIQKLDMVENQAKSNDFQVVRAICLHEICILSRLKGNLTDAVSFGLQAQQIYREFPSQPDEAKLLNDLGLAYFNLGEIEPARQSFSKAEELSRDGLGLQLAYAIGNRGLVERHLGNVEAAIVLFERALELVAPKNAQIDQANAITNLALCYRYLGQINHAKDLHEQALALRRAAKDRRGIASSLGHIASSHLVLGNLKEAENLLGEAILECEIVGERRSIGNLLDHRGRLLQQIGHIQEAVVAFQKALEISIEIGHKRSEATRKGRLAMALLRLGKPRPEYLPLAEEALRLSETIGDLRGVCRNSWYLGRIFRQTEPSKAMLYLERALPLSEQARGLRLQGRILQEMGNVLFYTNKYQQAIEKFRQAEAIYQQIGDRLGMNVVQINLGTAHHYSFNYPLALKTYENVMEHFAQENDQRWKANLLKNMGDVYRDMGFLLKAFAHYEQALALYQAPGRDLIIGRAMTLSRYGAAKYWYGDYQHAEKLLLQSLISLELSEETIRERAIAYAYLGLIESQKETASPDAAIKYVEKAIKVAGNLQADVKLQRNMSVFEGAVLVQINRPKEAVLILEAVLNRNETNQPNLRVQERAYWYLGLAYWQMEQFEPAKIKFATGIEFSRRIGNRYLIRDYAIRLKMLNDLENQYLVSLVDEIDAELNFTQKIG